MSQNQLTCSSFLFQDSAAKCFPPLRFDAVNSSPISHMYWIKCQRENGEKTTCANVLSFAAVCLIPTYVQESIDGFFFPQM